MVGKYEGSLPCPKDKGVVLVRRLNLNTVSIFQSPNDLILTLPYAM